ncbi:MAG: arginine--tRNA ligase [Christensenellaceae bacterium]|jgi:arginyl-tRNA synthetase|nr:arginine--tRNA ligase [Christensenellaceae bacterium]
MSIVEEKKAYISSLIKIDNVSNIEIQESLIPPPDPELGDFALPCFKFAKLLKTSPVKIAENIVSSITDDHTMFDKIVAINGYVNFKFNIRASANRVLSEIVTQKSTYANSSEGMGRTICIDYSSINIAKLMHIGHLSTTVIGGALYRIYKKLGYNPIGINHLGDWGTQFGKLIVAFKLWGNIEKLTNDGVSALTEIYVKFHAESETKPELLDMARAAFKRLEDGDPESVQLFELFKKITLDEVNKVYDRLHVHFDSYNGEAFYNDKMDVVINELDSLNLTEISDGAKIVDLSKYDMPPCLLVRSDGATLYATRDLAAAYYRKRTYDFYKCIYVVAYQQNLHFKQLFKVLELAGKTWAKDMIHVPFGMVSLEEGAMSTRRGNVILLMDVLSKAVEKSAEIMTVKNPALKDKMEIAEKIGVGAITFFALNNNRIKDIVFSYDKALSFDGETGPYIQYTNVRALSILRNLGVSDDYFSIPFTDDELAGLDNKESAILLSLLEKMPDILTQVIEKFEPSILSRYIIDVAKAFNRFYLENRIMNAETNYRRARATLTYATHIILEEGLRLLGIDAPTEM